MYSDPNTAQSSLIWLPAGTAKTAGWPALEPSGGEPGGEHCSVVPVGKPGDLCSRLVDSLALASVGLKCFLHQIIVISLAWTQ